MHVSASSSAFLRLAAIGTVVDVPAKVFAIRQVTAPKRLCGGLAVFHDLAFRPPLRVGYATRPMEHI